MRALFLAFLLLVTAGSARLAAQCSGTDLIAALPDESRAELMAQTAAVPYASGLFWKATRGDEVVHLMGTYHMADPRNDGLLAALRPTLEAATRLLVEAGPEEMSALKTRVGKEPGLMLNLTGPTIPELMSQQDWEKLTEALDRRGVPAFMAAKFKPWYLTMLLSIPPCAMHAMGEGKGLDALLIDEALKRDVPIQALEPYDTVFGIFGALPEKDQLSMITATLGLDDKSEDMSFTMAESYFAEEGRLIWEFTRREAQSVPGYAPDQAERDFATMEQVMMVQRNERWIPVIEAAAKDGPVLAAFGALHLSGEKGVLSLLEQAGFTLERLPL